MDQLNQTYRLLAELEHLFEAIPPNELRINLEELYHSYLAERNAILPSKDIARSMLFLIRFLNEVEAMNQQH